MNPSLENDQPPIEIRIPRYLFRYLRDNEFLEETIADPYLWFSSREHLNDPLDISNQITLQCKASEYIKYLLENTGVSIDYAEEMARSLAVAPDKGREIFEIIRSQFTDQMGICCFSYLHDSPLMWAHYAGAHTGLCLAVDAFELAEIFSFQEVEYTSRVKPWNLLGAEAKALSTIEHHLARDRAIFATKHLHWSHEREYRYLSKKIGMNSIPKQSILGLIFGSRMSPGRKVELQKIAYRRGIALFSESLIDQETGLVFTKWPANHIDVKVANTYSYMFSDDDLGIKKENSSP